MESSTYSYFSENSYYSKMDFSFKGKGLARLMSRDIENGTAISFEDSTIVKINYKKNRFSRQSFSEFLAEKNSSEQNQAENESENEESDNDDFDPIISDTSEIINGFESYKITLDNSDRKQFIWVTAKEEQSDIVKTMKGKISEFENSWGSFNIDFLELGMNENAILVKAVFSDEEGKFEYNLKKYTIVNTMPEMFNMPEDYKKVKKIKMF